MTTLDDKQVKAESLFKRKEAQFLDARKAMAEYELQGRETREKTARLRTLRLARESSGHLQHDRADPMGSKGPKGPNK